MRVRGIAVVVAATLALAIPAGWLVWSVDGDSNWRVAQSRRIFESGAGFGSVFLLNNELVQEELNLTEQQSSTATTIALEYVDRMRKLKEDAQRETPEQTVAESAAGDGKSDHDPSLLRMRLRELKRGYCEKAESLLSTEQLIRLSEIELQLRGPSILFLPEFLDILGVDEERHPKFQAVKRSWQEERGEVAVRYRAEEIAKPEFMAALDRINVEMGQEIVALLEPGERETYETMSGDEVSFNRDRLNLGIQTNRRLSGSRVKADAARNIPARTPAPPRRDS